MLVEYDGTIDQLMDRPLAAVFSGPSWDHWRALLRAAYALPMTERDRAVFARFTARHTVPQRPTREIWFVVGRRAGKSAIAALVAVYATCCCRYRLAPGETGIFMVIAADRKQARVIKRYISGLLRTSPALEVLIAPKGETKDSIRLTNGITIEIHTASFRTLRGYTVVGAACDELAFWRDDESANPDREILTALRAAMATIPNAMLVCTSSPYARRGELWRMYQRHFGKDDAPVLVVQGASRDFNPTLDADVVAAAYDDDPAAAAAEFGAEFRRDVESYVSPELLEDLVMTGRRELPPDPTQRYVAFTDPAGGGGSDSYTVAIAHRDASGRAVLDVVREARPPFSPEAVTAEFAALLTAFRISRVAGDRFAGEWPREVWRKHGVQYETATHTKSDLYRDLLPMLSSRSVELLDHPRLIAQLNGLERRTGRSGRDYIDHRPGAQSHDDVANAACGALVALALTARRDAFSEVELLGA